MGYVLGLLRVKFGTVLGTSLGSWTFGLVFSVFELEMLIIILLWVGTRGVGRFGVQFLECFIAMDDMASWQVSTLFTWPSKCMCIVYSGSSHFRPVIHLSRFLPLGFFRLFLLHLTPVFVFSLLFDTEYL